jgi:uncharacterized repeat protein (TIGR01451 family)
MFRKLVSNLPFSPSLINQLGFYSRRLKKERATRQIGLIFTILAILVQSVTFLVPAKATLASSSNDIIYGGNGKTKQGIINAYVSGRDAAGNNDIKAIFNAYGINEMNLSSARVTNIHSTLANNYWSIGRSVRSYGGVNVPVRIPGGPTVYSRTLHGWNGGLNKWWDALEVNTAQGTRWILLECGNIVTQNKPEDKKPEMKLEKSVDKLIANKGEKVKFTLKVTNVGDAEAKNIMVYDATPEGLDLTNEGLGNQTIQSPRRWETKRFNMAPGQTFTYGIYANITKTGPAFLQNKACVDIIDGNIYNNCDTVTVTVPQPCPIPGKENLPHNHPDCKSNPNLKIEKSTTTKNLKVGDTFNYDVKVTNTGDVDFAKTAVRDVAPEELEFLQLKQPGDSSYVALINKREFTTKNFVLKKKQSVTLQLKAKVIKGSLKPVNNQACAVAGTNTQIQSGACDDEKITVKEPCPSNPKLTLDDPNCKPCPVPGKQNLPASDPTCKPCDETKQDENGADISCLELHKKARNITQSIANANGTQANAGDTIEYTLSVTNRAKLTRKAFVVEENMQDVLEYADIIDASGATYADKPIKMLTWKPVDIKPNETINRTILIKIKSTIPTTPASTSDPLSYDMKLANVYGDTVQIDLPPNPIKTVEQTVNTLPNTGLGANILISTVLLFAATYFYFRSRLMVKELGLVRQQFNYGAGV